MEDQPLETNVAPFYPSLLRILILEDKHADAQLLLHELKSQGFTFEHRLAASEVEFRQNLEWDFDLVLAEYRLQDFTALDAFEILRPIKSTVPFIVVAGTVGEENAVEFLKKGVSDYVMKDRLARLGTAIRQALEASRWREHRTKTEKQLQQQALLLDLVPDAILVRNMAGRITYWNAAAERIYGWTRTEVLSLSADRQPCQEPRLFETIRASLKKSGTWNGETVQKSKTGKPIYFTSRWSLIPEEEGGSSAILEVNTDVTDQKQMETQFFRTQRMDEITTLVSGIAHDLNNILSPISLSAGVLRSMKLSAEGQEILTNIEVSARRGGEIIKQLLSFGKITTGEKVVVQLKHLATSMAKTARETFNRGIDFTTKIRPDLRPILGHPTQLNQLLLDLCLESCDRMPNVGSLTIQADNLDLDDTYALMSRKGKAGPYIVFRIVPGRVPLPPAVFCRDEKKGEELSVNIHSRWVTMERIVDNHHGFIQRQKLNEKTDVLAIFLPAYILEEKRAETPIDPDFHSNETVLVVDDESPIADMISHILTQNGCYVLRATNGAEALRLFVQHLADDPIVVTDLMMPQMDGFAFIQALRAIRPTVRVLVSTGTNSRDLQSLIQDPELMKVLIKPYSSQCLLRALKSISLKPEEALAPPAF